MNHLFPYPKMGYSFTEILVDPLTRKLLGHDAVHAEKTPFVSGVTSRLKFLLNDPMKHLSFLKIGYTALEAFLQANVTGPPLDFDSEPIIFPDTYRDQNFAAVKQEIFRDLTVDGDEVYSLTPRIELFWLAKTVLSSPQLAEIGFNGRRARLRINFWHQKLMQERSDTLREHLYSDAKILGDLLSKRLETRAAASEEHFVEFLLERAAILIYYGDDEKARDDLARAAGIRNFQFALVGALGKRTKFQNQDISQLVVLAKSRDYEPEPYSSRKSSRADPSSRKSSINEIRSPSLGHRPSTPASSIAMESTDGFSPVGRRKSSIPEVSMSQPENIPLNDDTLREKILFTQKFDPENQLTQLQEEGSELPPDLEDLDPGNQPMLFPVDSIILLSTASSISNTSPEDGLTREETLPYATRALEGGSSNWQVYTQALLVRSRIEGYKSRTAERGLLQLQALVDQVIAELSGKGVTTKKGSEADEPSSEPTTFLPKLEVSEAATVAERLKYIYQLSPPLRWELEAELAQRWTTLGGLRTALEIYERLQMQAEVALCLAATDREAEAEKLLKSILFDDSTVSEDTTPKIKSPQPSDAPRLLCILGDISKESKYYTLAWKISNNRYARAQRSLGRLYAQQRNLQAAAESYSLALRITRLDTATWFALGCIHLELQEWPSAVECFKRVIQQEDNDAEAWSNLAIALLKLPPPTAQPAQPETDSSLDEDPARQDPLKHTYSALRALRRAANLKRDDARIWDNFLTVAASIPPVHGTPWNEIIQAMSRIIDLRGSKQGEGAVDLKILEAVINHVSETYDYPRDDDGESDTKAEGTDVNGDNNEDENENEPPRPRIPFQATALLRLIDTQVQPLATSPTLFLLLSKLSLWRHRPAESLGNVEKAWRATTAQPGAYDDEAKWNEVVDVTVQLVEAYEALGERERERTGGPVEKGWRFKSRTAVRGVMGRGKELWEDTEGWKRLEKVLEEVKG